MHECAILRSGHWHIALLLQLAPVAQGSQCIFLMAHLPYIQVGVAVDGEVLPPCINDQPCWSLARCVCGHIMKHPFTMETPRCARQAHMVMQVEFGLKKSRRGKWSCPCCRQNTEKREFWVDNKEWAFGEAGVCAFRVQYWGDAESCPLRYNLVRVDGQVHVLPQCFMFEPGMRVWPVKEWQFRDVVAQEWQLEGVVAQCIIKPALARWGVDTGYTWEGLRVHPPDENLQGGPMKRMQEWVTATGVRRWFWWSPVFGVIYEEPKGMPTSDDRALP